MKVSALHFEFFDRLQLLQQPIWKSIWSIRVYQHDILVFGKKKDASKMPSSQKSKAQWHPF